MMNKELINEYEEALIYINKKIENSIFKPFTENFINNLIYDTERHLFEVFGLDYVVKINYSFDKGKLTIDYLDLKVKN